MQATEFVHISLESIYQVLKDDWFLEWIYRLSISVLNCNKIPEKLEKSEFFVGGPKISILKIDLFFVQGHENEQFGKVSSKFMHILGF